MLTFNNWITIVGTYLHAIYKMSGESKTKSFELFAQEEYNGYLHRSEYK